MTILSSLDMLELDGVASFCCGGSRELQHLHSVEETVHFSDGDLIDASADVPFAWFTSVLAVLDNNVSM